jgi:YidC/Oxa1 family membrane protein insertase
MLDIKNIIRVALVAMLLVVGVGANTASAIYTGDDQAEVIGGEDGYQSIMTLSDDISVAEETEATEEVKSEDETGRMGLWNLLIVQPIFNVLLILYSLLSDFGVALIIFTILVKIALWPLMKRQLHQTRLMRKIQPELAEIKKRCKGNRQLETLQMMELYKRNDVKPFRSLLVLIVQLPVFIAIFSIVNMASRGGEEVQRFAYPFVEGLPRVAEAIAGGEEFALNLFGFIDLRAYAFPGGGATLSAFILLAFIFGSAILQYLTAKQQLPSAGKKKTFKQIMAEAKEGKQADSSELNNVVGSQMAKIMPVMMFLIMMGLPGAVVLYFMSSTVISFVQQRRIFKQGFDEMDNVADKKILKELGKIQEAEIVKKSDKKDKEVGGAYKKSSKPRENVTRIVAKEKGGKKKRRK